MPGIAADSIAPIQAGLITQGGEAPPSLAIGDLMSGFKSGFITVDDLQKRASEEVTRNDQQKTLLQANEIKRKLAPGEAENELAMQGLQKSRIAAATELFPGQTELARNKMVSDLDTSRTERDLLSTDPEILHAAKEHVRDLEYRKYYGQMAPNKIEVLVPEERQQPKPSFDEWLEKNYSKQLDSTVVTPEGLTVKQFKPGADIAEKLQNFVPAGGVPLDSDAANAQRDVYRKTLEAQAKQEEQAARLARNVAKDRLKQNLFVEQAYNKMVDLPQKEWVKKGSPEYDAAMEAKLAQARERDVTEKGRLAAIPVGLAATATETAKAVAAGPAARAKAETDSVDRLAKRIQDSKVLDNVDLKMQAYDNIDQLKQLNRPFTNSDDVALLYNFVKTMDPNAVREGEIMLAKSTNPGAQQYINELKGFFVDHNKILGNDARQNLINTVDAQKKATIAEARDAASLIAREAKLSNVPLDRVFKDRLLEIVTGKTPKPSPTREGYDVRAGTSDNGPQAPLAGAANPVRPPLGLLRVTPSSGPYAGKLMQWVGPGLKDYAEVLQ